MNLTGGLTTQSHVNMDSTLCGLSSWGHLPHENIRCPSPCWQQYESYLWRRCTEQGSDTFLQQIKRTNKPSVTEHYAHFSHPWYKSEYWGLVKVPSLFLAKFSLSRDFASSFWGQEWKKIFLIITFNTQHIKQINTALETHLSRDRISTIFLDPWDNTPKKKLGEIYLWGKPDVSGDAKNAFCD